MCYPRRVDTTARRERLPALFPKVEEPRETYKPLWLLSYAVALFLSALLALRPSERPHGTPMWLVSGLTLVATFWHWFMVLRQPTTPKRSVWLWVGVAIVLEAMLVWMAPVYLFAVVFLVAAMFVLLPKRSAVAAVTILAAMLFAPTGASLGRAFATATVMSTFGVGTIAAFVVAHLAQVRRHKRRMVEAQAVDALVRELGRCALRLEERARAARSPNDAVTVDAALFAASESLQTTLAKIRRFGRHMAPRVSVAVDEDAVLDLEQQAIMLRIVEEAMHNVLRHSRAKRAKLTLSVVGARVVIEVSDDGVGFDSRLRGRGIHVMEARARALGGSLAIESGRGAGTTVHIEAPIWRSLSRARSLGRV